MRMDIDLLEGVVNMARTLFPWAQLNPSLFDDFGKELGRILERVHDGEQGDSNYFAPRLNIAETDKSYEVTVDLPGMNSDNFNIEFKDGQLWISGERKQETQENEKKTYHRIERRYGAFRRVIALGTDIDIEKVEASYRDGVLTLNVPKAVAVQPRRIQVKS